MNINMRCCAVLAALAVTCTATAEIRVFVTPASAGYGLTVPDNAHRPTFSTVEADGYYLNAYDYYYSQHPELPGGAAGHYFSVAAYPPVDAPLGTPDDPIEIAAGDFAYIWFQFVDEAKGATLTGLEVLINGPGDFTPTYYLQNDLSGDSPVFLRWNGPATAPNYPEWHNNPQTLVAVTARGIANGNSFARNMFDHQAASGSDWTGVALLGAVQLNSYGMYSIEIRAWGYGGGGTAEGVADPSYFTYVPEPAAWMLAGLIALALRRRAWVARKEGQRRAFEATSRPGSHA